MDSSTLPSTALLFVPRTTNAGQVDIIRSFQKSPFRAFFISTRSSGSNASVQPCADLLFERLAGRVDTAPVQHERHWLMLFRRAFFDNQSSKEERIDAAQRITDKKRGFARAKMI